MNPELQKNGLDLESTTSKLHQPQLKLRYKTKFEQNAFKTFSFIAFLEKVSEKVVL